MKMSTTAKKRHVFKNFSDGADCPAGNNRRVLNRTRDGKREIVRTLHGHEVAVLTEETSGYTLRLDFCGWHTQTTVRAMREFIYYAGVGGLYLGTQYLFRAGAAYKVGDEINIPLDPYMEAELVVNNIRRTNTRIHWDCWNCPSEGLELAGDYVVCYYLADDVPTEIQAHTKGRVVPANADTMKWLLKARKPETRMARLTQLLITGEAVCYAWV